MKKSSFEYIIKVLKSESPKNNPDWYDIMGFLYCNNVAGLFYNRAKKQQIELPFKINKLLQETFERQKRRVELMRSETEKISDELTRFNSGYAFLKGTVLVNNSDPGIYDDGERISNDIDLLVKSNEIDEITKVLKSLGYIQGRYNNNTKKIEEFSRTEVIKRRLTRGEIAPFVRTTNSTEVPFIEVDINFSLGNTPSEYVKLLVEMIDSSIEYKGRINLRSLNPEMFFLHLIIHQYKECSLMFMTNRGKDLDLYKLADIYYLLNSNDLDVEKILYLANQYEILEELYTIVAQVSEVFGNSDLPFNKKSDYLQPVVKDYDTGKEYRWDASVSTRIIKFDAKEFLKEIKI